MADNENKKPNEKVKNETISKEIKNERKKNTETKEITPNKKETNIKKEETNGNYFTGIIGAVIGGAIGAVPWIIAYIYGNMMIALLAILIAGGAYYGYKICKGKMTKKVTLIITIISIIIVAIVSLLIIPAILIHTEGMNTNWATIEYLYQDEEFTSGIIRDTFIAIVFTAVGVAVINSSIKKDLEEGVANKEQTPEEFAKEKQEAISKIKPIFEKYNAVSKEHTIDKIELEAELELNNIDKKLLTTLQSVEIVKKEKGKFYYNSENENKEIIPKKKMSKSNIIAIIVAVIAIIAVIAIVIYGYNKKNATIVYNDGTVSFEMNTTWIEYSNYYAGGWNYYKYISNMPLSNTNEIDANEIDYTTYPAMLNVNYYELDTNEYSSLQEIADYMAEYINSAEDKPEYEQEITKTEKGYEVLKIKAKYNTEPAQVEYMYYILNGNTVATVDGYSFTLNDEKELAKVVENVANSFDWVTVSE